jgi:hypothetical protein
LPGADRERGSVRTASRWLALAVALLPAVAAAHVKWFVNYDLLSPPRPVLAVVSGNYFMLFGVLAAPLIFCTSLLDGYLAKRTNLHERRTQALADGISLHFPLLLRIGVAAFFSAVFVYGCLYNWMILTPELRTPSQWVCWIQLGVAVFALYPRTAALSGLGIVCLYADGIAEYGIFHMLDYPIFLGVAAYLIIPSLWGGKREELARSTLRIFTAVTLLWASIEKFAFPEWSFLLMTERPGIALGFEPEFYMVAAGFVEYCTAFLLITGNLAARAAAMLLLALFVSAIVPFGVIDAIGHLVIIVVLTLLIFSNNAVARRFDWRGSTTATAAVHTVLFFGSLVLFVAAYYGGYYLDYGLNGGMR